MLVQQSSHFHWSLKRLRGKCALEKDIYTEVFSSTSTVLVNPLYCLCTSLNIQTGTLKSLVTLTISKYS